MPETCERTPNTLRPAIISKPVDRPLLIIDGDNLAHRAYHSTPKTVTDAEGRPINAIVGVINMLVNQWQREQPGEIFVAWDTLGVDTYRSELWPAYQGGRVFEDALVRQLNMLPEVCRAFNFGVGKCAGCEADDLMASAAVKHAAEGGHCLILTTDRDSYQLASEQITILSPKRGSRDLVRIGPLQVVEYFGVLPQQVPDFKALAGDASDKIPGVRGVGPKAAAALLLKHGTLERVLEAWGPHPEAELALKFKHIATMRTDVPVDLPVGRPDWESGAQALRELGAGNLAERIQAVGTA